MNTEMKNIRILVSIAFVFCLVGIFQFGEQNKFSEIRLDNFLSFNSAQAEVYVACPADAPISWSIYTTSSKECMVNNSPWGWIEDQWTIEWGDCEQEEDSCCSYPEAEPDCDDEDYMPW